MPIKKQNPEEPKKEPEVEGQEEESDFDPKKVTSDEGDDLHDAYYGGEDDDDEKEIAAEDEETW